MEKDRHLPWCQHTKAEVTLSGCGQYDGVKGGMAA